jgi:hypothetical protein
VFESARHLLKVFGARGTGRSTDKSVFSANDDSEFSSPVDADSYTCPNCGAQDLTRIRRRLIDRPLAIFTGARRFRCTHVDCLWEGNLRRRKSSSSRSGS